MARKNAKVTDFINEEELTKREKRLREAFVDENGMFVHEDANGVRRDPESGLLVKGTKPLQGPAGTQRKKLKELQNYLSITLGPNGERCVDELIKMITYDPVKAEQEYLQYCKDNNISRPQKFDHYYKAPDKFRALELVLKYNVGSPPQKIEKTEDINVQIEHKISNIAKLVSQNKEYLQLIEGGKKDNDIIDGEEIKN